MNANLLLKNHWQKSPAVLRKMIDIREIPDIQTLFQIAQSDEVESRIVIEHPDAPYWSLFHGPFDEQTFHQLPDSHWTLLLQDMDKHLPEIAALIKSFRFIPDWRIDDIMISYAVDKGSVGPHTDEYDVFLIQAAGKRRWQIHTQETTESDLLEDVDLRILKDFTPEQEWVLEPGDILYLPPGVAHWGVAEGECMTFSVGFRAPSSSELLSAFTEYHDESGEAQRYTDADRQIDNAMHPAELVPQDLSDLKNLLLQALEISDENFACWAGRYLTEPKPHLYPVPPEAPLDIVALEDGGLRCHPYTRLLFTTAGNVHMLFANGEHFTFSDSLLPLVKRLCDKHRLGPDELAPWLNDAEALRLLEHLHDEGAIITDA